MLRLTALGARMQNTSKTQAIPAPQQTTQYRKGDIPKLTYDSKSNKENNSATTLL